LQYIRVTHDKTNLVEEDFNVIKSPPLLWGDILFLSCPSISPYMKQFYTSITIECLYQGTSNLGCSLVMPSRQPYWYKMYWDQ